MILHNHWPRYCPLYVFLILGVSEPVGAFHNEVFTAPNDLGAPFGSSTMIWCDPVKCNSIDFLSVGSDVHAWLKILADDEGSMSWGTITGSELEILGLAAEPVRIGDRIFTESAAAVVDGITVWIDPPELSDQIMDIAYPGWSTPPILEEGSLGSAFYNGSEETAFKAGSIIEVAVSLQLFTIPLDGGVYPELGVDGMILVFDGVRQRTDVYAQTVDKGVYFLLASNTMPVPLPAAGVLYLSAILVLGWLRRR